MAWSGFGRHLWTVSFHHTHRPYLLVCAGMALFSAPLHRATGTERQRWSSFTKSVDNSTNLGRTCKDVEWSIPRQARISILGRSRLANAALLRLITGLETPSTGWIERRGTVSPLRPARFAYGRTTIRQLIDQLSILYHVDQRNLVDFVSAFGNLSTLLDIPVMRLVDDDRQRLNAALLYGIPFDYHVLDGRPGRGPQDVRELCAQAFARRAQTAGIILVTSDLKAAREIGGMPMLLHDGHLHRFERFDDAVAAFRLSELKLLLPPQQ